MKINSDKLKTRMEFNRSFVKSLRDARIKREKRAAKRAAAA